MTLTHSSSATLFLLLSLSVIASAGGYGYDQKPDTAKPNYTYNSKSKPGTSKPKYSYDPKPQPDVVKPDLHKPYYDSNPKPTLPKPKFTEPKPDNGYDSKPYLGQPTIPKQDTAKPNYGYNPKPEVPKPKLTMPKPNYGNGPKPKLIVPKPDTAKPNYGYNPKPDVPKPNYEYVPKPNLLKPKMTVPKPDHGYEPKEKVYEQPKATTPKPENITPHDGYAQKPNLPEPKLYIPKPGNDKLDYDYEHSPIGVEGFVLCKQGSNYTPIEGAVIRIACTAVDQYGYKKVPFSCSTEATNAKGYYFKTLPALKLTECKAYLESSPLKTCNVPTDMNFGITGAPLSAYHILHDKKIKLYSMRTFFYTSTAPCKKEAKGSRGLCFTLENPSSTFHQNPWSALRHLLNLVQEENSACMINDENDNFTGDDQEFLLTDDTRQEIIITSFDVCCGMEELPLLVLDSESMNEVEGNIKNDSEDNSSWLERIEIKRLEEEVDTERIMEEETKSVNLVEEDEEGYSSEEYVVGEEAVGAEKMTADPTVAMLWVEDEEE